MTVFDKLDRERITIRGHWNTGQVWVNDELLDQRVPEDGQPSGFTWGDTSHEKGKPRKIQNLAIAISEQLESIRDNSNSIRYLVYKLGGTSHFRIVESDEISWLNEVLRTLQQQDFIIKLNMRTRSLINYYHGNIISHE